MFRERIPLYKQLENKRQSKVITYITGDRPGLETQMHPEVLDHFVDHLDKFGYDGKISLLLYTRGGEIMAGWSIANLIRQFCKDFEVIVPSKAHSSGTLLALGADRILMTKQATLSPIDPSTQGPLHPQIPGMSPHVKAPVSVEAINGYLGLAQDAFGIKNETSITAVFLKLSEAVHPLVLGDVHRIRTQIRMLAKNLLSLHITDSELIETIIKFLCEESGSHDYLINRREARDKLKLKIDKPDDELYILIKKIYNDIRTELELDNRFEPVSVIGAENQKDYSLRRGLIESIEGDCKVFISEGTLIKKQIQIPPNPPQTIVEDNRRFEGWRFENAV